MNTINDIRNKIGCHPNGYEWPGELAQPGHVLWKFAKYLSQNPSENCADIAGLVNGILEERSFSVSGNPCFLANLEILKGLADSKIKDQSFSLAANEYAKLLAGFDFDCPLSLGKQIVKLTVEALQPKTSQTSCFVARSFFLVAGRAQPMAIPFFVKVLPTIEKPCLLFDPIALGIINFHLGDDDKNFLRLSVLPAWQWYLDKFKEDSKPLQWGLGHPQLQESLEHSSHKESSLEKKIPSPDLLNLEGNSAGGAFAMAFRSAHEETPLDQNIAISCAIKKNPVGIDFFLLPVGDLSQKGNVQDISKILYKHNS